MNQVPLSSSSARLPLAALRESPTNSRTVFTGLDELAETIRAKGVIQPLLVRPLTKPEKGGVTHEIVAGARRFRASLLAKVNDAPVVIRTVSDDEADDLNQIENLQREDLTPLDEAQGLARMAAKPGQTVQSVATRLGKKPEYVAGRIALLKLTEEPRQALAAEQIGLAHAIKIASLPADLQKQALAACFAQSWRNEGLLPIIQLTHWIERNVLLSLDKAPFDLNSIGLVSDAGSCNACAKRTGATQLLFPGVATDSCLDRACFQSKVSAYVDDMREQRPELVQISTQAFSSKDGVLGMDQFVVIQPKKRSKQPEHQKCDHARDALVVHGHDAGAQHIVCADPTCRLHHARTNERRQQDSEQRDRVRNEEREKKLQMSIRRALGDAILRKFKSPTTTDWQFIATRAMMQMPHEHGIDLAKRYGCYPKTKQPSGSEIRDALQKHIAALDSTACQRFLFDMALLPMIRNQYSTSAESELKTIAKRFRLDPASIAKTVREQAKKAPQPKRKKGAA